jgi:hypothetical protein
MIFAPADFAGLLDLERKPENEPAVKQPASNAELETLARYSLVILDVRGRAEAESVAVQSDAQHNVHLTLRFRPAIPGPTTIRSGLLARLPRGHRQFVTVEDQRGQKLQERMLDAAHDSLALDLPTREVDLRARPQVTSITSAPSNESRLKSGGVASFLSLGVHHILTGYDHLLFLFALLVVSRGFLAAAKIITAFTLAHSITLAAATLNLVNVSPRIVEPLIAASIVFVGVENLVRRGEAKGRWLLAFAFGLVHGLGFAGAWSWARLAWLPSPCRWSGGPGSGQKLRFIWCRHAPRSWSWWVASGSLNAPSICNCSSEAAGSCPSVRRQFANQHSLNHCFAGTDQGCRRRNPPQAVPLIGQSQIAVLVHDAPEIDRG